MNLNLRNLQPQLLHWGSLGLLMTVVAGAGVPVRAQTVAVDLVAVESANIPEADPGDEELLPQRRPNPAASSVALESHAYKDLFSIGFPEGWQVTEQEGTPQLTALAVGASPEAASTVRTEVTWHATPPQQFVSQAIQAIQAEGYTVARYDAINMDGTSAIRLWLTDLPDQPMPNAFISYVGYANGTAEIASYYGDRSDDLDNLLSGVHQSFQRTVTEAETPTPEESTTEVSP